MYYRLLLLVTVLFSTFSLNAQTLTESFETDGEGTRYESNNFTVGCGTDWFRRTFDGECSTASHNFRDLASNNAANEDGTFYFAGSDIEEGNAGENPLGDGESAYIVFPTQAITGGNNTFDVTIKFAAENDASGSFEGEESLFVEYAFDTDIATGANCSNCLPAEGNVNTGTYTVAGAFWGNTATERYQEDTDLNGTPDGTELSGTFTDFTFTFMTTGTPSNLSLRIRFFHDQSSEDIGFDHIRLSSRITVLPVELSRFTAQNYEDHTLLDWETESESENLGFDIERSLDGENWRAIGFVEGNGTTSTAQTYRFKDEALLANIHYYRLRQIDFDGSSQYSKVVVTTRETVDVQFSIIPNPATDRIEIQGVELEGHEVIITDYLGRSILSVQPTDQSIDVSALPAGWYQMNLFVGSQPYVQSFIIK